MSFPTEGAYLMDLIYAVTKAKILWGDVPVSATSTLWEDGDYQIRVYHTFAATEHTSMRAELAVESDGTFNERIIYETPTGGSHVKYNEEVPLVGERHES